MMMHDSARPQEDMARLRQISVADCICPYTKVLCGVMLCNVLSAQVPRQNRRLNDVGVSRPSLPHGGSGTTDKADQPKLNVEPGLEDYIPKEGGLTLSVEEVAKLLGISRATAYELVRQGKIPSLRLGARRLVVPKVALARMLRDAVEKSARTPEEY